MCETAQSMDKLFSKKIPRFFTFEENLIISLPIFKELQFIDFSLERVPQSNISVLSLFFLS